MKRTLLITAAAMLLLTVGAFAQRGGDCGHPCGGPGMKGHGMGMQGDGHGMGPGMLLNMADEIGLSDQQQKDLSAMSEKFGLEKIEKKATLDKAKLKLRTLRMNDGSESEVLKAMDEVGKMRTEMQKMRYQHRQAVKDLLTEEQVDKLGEMRKDRMGKRGCDGPCGGHGMMRDGDGPHGMRGGKM